MVGYLVVIHSIGIALGYRDVIRSFRQVIDLLRQIRDALAQDPGLRDKMLDCLGCINRDIVLATELRD